MLRFAGFTSHDAPDKKQHRAKPETNAGFESAEYVSSIILKINIHDAERLYDNA
jgi:hypothetical protein